LSAVSVDGSIAPSWAISDTAVRHIRIWVYDGILASGVAGSIDVFTAANAVWADKNGHSRGTAALFE
jgi:hypothetical protein